MSDDKLKVRTAIWDEEPEADNPFAARACHAHGYDVYGQLLPHASWFEYLLLLFRGERPPAADTRLLERLAVALANPGPRDASVRAAMNSGVSRSTHAATLMAALAVGAGEYGGSHEVFIVMQLWRDCGFDPDAWKARLLDLGDDTQADIWQAMEHAPGFDPNGVSCPLPVRQTLDLLAEISPGRALAWLREHRPALEAHVGYPLALTGVMAAAFHDLNLDEHQASMLFLMLRLPGAAVHALEQRHQGWKQFPFFGNRIELTDDPGDKGLPVVEGVKL